MVSRGHMMCVMALMLLLSVTCPVTSQINFSPTWGTGKRSGRGDSPGPIPLVQSNSDNCWTQNDLRIVSQLAQMIKHEAERLSGCMQTGQPMPPYKEKRQFRYSD
ncbi:uncharacterized protein [Littorina saxatilis]|uniref:Adipokinetic hormone n=1 Tax=Littorina saxatilis TaxID=31220 RepID=A0AAN9BWC6_9CAEN